jgi:hypothetical protein
MRIRAHHRAAAAALLAVVPAAAGAQTTENRFGGTASVTGAFSNNPFSETDNGDTTGSAFANIDVSPNFRHLTERSILTAYADANFQQYVRRYGHNESVSGGVDYSLRPAERITTHLALNLSSQILGSVNSYLPTVTAPSLTVVPATTTTNTTSSPGTTTTPAATPVIDPGLLLPTTSPLLTDVGLYGLRNRRRSAQLSGDTSIGVTARDSLTLSAYGEVTRYGQSGGLILGDYNAYGGTAGYQRRISSYFNVGLQGSASLYDYRSGFGNSRVYSVSATASGRLSPLWSVNGSLGVSFVDGSTAGSTRATSISGSLNACRRGQRSTLCAQAARQVSPTGVGGTQYVTTVGLNWSEQLSERSGLSLNADYSKVGSGDLRLVSNGLPLQSQYVQATAGYNHQLRRRLGLVASAYVRQLFGGGGNVDRAVDVGGQAGISYRFGDLR